MWSEIWKGEKEACRKHVRTVSDGRGHVPEHVWSNIPVAQGKADWLAAKPSKIEMSRCISKMKVRRAAGQDRMVAELLKYGGKRLVNQVYAVVQRMWAAAATGHDGAEAATWPKEWRVGLVVPMWKRNGKTKARQEHL